jgi:adenylate kinase
MSAGEVVPDELVDQVVRERLESLAPEQGFVPNGYPRTPQEARALRRMLARLRRLEQRPLVVTLDVSQPADAITEDTMRQLGQAPAQPTCPPGSVAYRH